MIIALILCGKSKLAVFHFEMHEHWILYWMYFSAHAAAYHSFQY